MSYEKSNKTFYFYWKQSGVIKIINYMCKMGKGEVFILSIAI